MNKFLAIIILILLFPVFFIISVFIILDDGRPIFFTQKRVGIDNSFFRMYKFRSMKTNTPNIATDLLENPKQYVLKVGIALRKLSLDELPNLLNIIKGDMVFVGPRPSLYNQDDLIQLRTAAGIDKLKPGLTGWAQVNGRDKITLEEKVALDKIYLENRSLMFDIKIFFRTFSLAFLKQKGINH